MAEIVIKVTTEGGEKSLKNINDLKSAISQLEAESASLDLGSEAFEKSKQQIDDLKKKYQELAKSQQQLDAETADKANKAVEQHAQRAEKIGNNVQKFAAGLTDAFAGAFIALGASEKDAAKLNATLQQGVGIALGVKGGIEAIVAGVELAGPAFEAFNAIIAANPIGAVVIAVAALTAGIYLLVKAFEEEEKSSNAVNDSLRRNRDAHRENEIELKKIALEKQLRNKEISEDDYKRALAEFDLNDKRAANVAATTKDIIKLYEDFGYDINKGAKLRQKRDDIITRDGQIIKDTAWAQEKKNYDKFLSELNKIYKLNKDLDLETQKVINAKVQEDIDKANAEEAAKNKEKYKTLSKDKAKAAEEERLFQLAYTKKQLEDVGKLIDADEKEIKKGEKEKLDQSYKNLEDYTNKTSELNRQADAERIKAEGDRLQAISEYKQIVNQSLDAVGAAFARMDSEGGKLGSSIVSNLGNAFKVMSNQASTDIQKVTAGLDALNGILNAINSYQNQMAAERVASNEAELNTKLTNLNESKENELAVLQQNNAAQLENENLTADQKDEINKSYNAKKAQIEYNAAMAEYNLKLQTYKADTEVKKKAFEQDKKLRIATTIISTISGALQAYVGMLSLGPYGPIAGALSAAAVVALGAIQVSQINAQKFDAGTPPAAPKIQAPNTSDGGGSGSSNRAQQGPDLYAINGDTNTGQGGQGERRSNSTNEPIRAYVVTEDISASQNKNAVIERRSSF